MSITDELREWKGSISTRLQPETVLALRSELNCIADRIDAEYQKAIRELNYLAEHSIFLPVDADGVPIRAGDVLDGYGKTIEVVELRHGRSGWLLISRDGNGYDDTFVFTHHHAPTVEDVLREFADRVCNSGHQWGLDADDTIAEYAPKLRLAVDE